MRATPARPAHCGNLLGGMVAGMVGGMVRRGAGLVGGQVEKKEDYLPHLISPPMLVGIQCPYCQHLLCIAEDYSGSA